MISGSDDCGGSGDCGGGSGDDMVLIVVMLVVRACRASLQVVGL